MAQFQIGPDTCRSQHAMDPWPLPQPPKSLHMPPGGQVSSALHGCILQCPMNSWMISRVILGCTQGSQAVTLLCLGQQHLTPAPMRSHDTEPQAGSMQLNLPALKQKALNMFEVITAE